MQIKNSQIEGVINLGPLCELHKATDEPQNKVSLEELFAVFTNPSVIEAIVKAREEIKKETGVALPTENKKEVFEARKILYENKWNWYQKLIENICLDHNLRGQNYWYNPLDAEYLPDRIEQSTSDLTDFFKDENKDSGTPMPSDEEIRRMANRDTINDILKDELTNLECAIFYNDPVMSRRDIGMPFGNRGGYLKVKQDLHTGEAYIEAKFYINSTKADIEKTIENAYLSMDASRKRILGIEPKKLHAKENLSKIYRIYQLASEGKNEAQIANALEKEKLATDTTFDLIRQVLKRIREENKRFDTKTF